MGQRNQQNSASPSIPGKPEDVPNTLGGGIELPRHDIEIQNTFMHYRDPGDYGEFNTDVAPLGRASTAPEACSPSTQNTSASQTAKPSHQEFEACNAVVSCKDTEETHFDGFVSTPLGCSPTDPATAKTFLSTRPQATGARNDGPMYVTTSCMSGFPSGLPHHEFEGKNTFVSVANEEDDFQDVASISLGRSPTAPAAAPSIVSSTLSSKCTASSATTSQTEHHEPTSDSAPSRELTGSVWTRSLECVTSERELGKVRFLWKVDATRMVSSKDRQAVSPELKFDIAGTQPRFNIIITPVKCRDQLQPEQAICTYRLGIGTNETLTWSDEVRHNFGEHALSVLPDADGKDKWDFKSAIDEKTKSIVIGLELQT